ncbi:exosome complex component RRP42 [Tanacetum coccineum]|uniref:Ribosomal RNA-processing protein 42 n=1 Tax=Tanacetum coccineum TaxID=301880 RepID=A0ABQ5GCS0_9ASTR
MVGLSIGEKHFIQGGIAQDLRTDGRKRLTYRPIVVETGVIAQANGSARVKMGRTEVIASVKAELGRPTSSAPDKGKVSIYIDCSPTAAPEFERRGGEELSMELSAALRQCLLGGKTGAGAGINLSSLSIVDGKVCWDLYIDGLVISMDGNVLDALGAAIKLALPFEVPTLGVVAYGVVAWTQKKKGANRDQHSRDQRARSGGLWSGGLDPKRGANRDQRGRWFFKGWGIVMIPHRPSIPQVKVSIPTPSDERPEDEVSWTAYIVDATQRRQSQMSSAASDFNQQQGSSNLG